MPAPKATGMRSGNLSYSDSSQPAAKLYQPDIANRLLSTTSISNVWLATGMVNNALDRKRHHDPIILAFQQ
jgi:hypothetical protein